MAKTEEHNKEQKPVVQQEEIIVNKPSLEDKASDLFKQAHVLFMAGQTGGQIRSHINEMVNLHADTMNADEKKSFSKILREKSDRFRQFGEVVHQELTNITSQVGW